MGPETVFNGFTAHSLSNNLNGDTVLVTLTRGANFLGDVGQPASLTNLMIEIVKLFANGRKVHLADSAPGSMIDLNDVEDDVTAFQITIPRERSFRIEIIKTKESFFAKLKRVFA